MVVNIKATQRDTYTVDSFWGDVHLLPEPLLLPRGSPAAFLEVGGPAAPLTTSWIIGSFLSGPSQQQRKLQSSEQRELEKQTRRENNCRPHVFPLPVTLPNQTSRAGICSAEDEPRLSLCISGPSQRPAKTTSRHLYYTLNICHQTYLESITNFHTTSHSYSPCLEMNYPRCYCFHFLPTPQVARC